MKNCCAGIGDETAMLAYIGGLSRGGLLRHALTHEHESRTLNLNGMIATASAYAVANDDARGPLQAVMVRNQQKKGNGNKWKNSSNDQQQEAFDMVAMTFSSGAKAEAKASDVGAEVEEANITVTRSRLPDPVLPKLMRSIAICPIFSP
jgi:hypothetical protein